MASDCAEAQTVCYISKVTVQITSLGTFLNPLHISVSLVSGRLSLELISLLSTTAFIQDFTYIVSVKPTMIMGWNLFNVEVQHCLFSSERLFSS